MQKPDGHTFRANLRRILDILEPLGQAEASRFLFWPKGSLGGVTPLEALIQGRYEAVKRAAEGFRDR
jgi:hypothetical protein